MTALLKPVFVKVKSIQRVCRILGKRWREVAKETMQMNNAGN
jgi:hypothetical protein